LLALEALESNDRLVYNLGNGTGYSVLEVIETARQVTGHPIPLVEAPRRPGDAARLVASSERIQGDLGWKPKIPDLKDIVASAWEWHRTHPRGYEE
jgi:UDP-glucose 4-epimerase